MHIPIKPASLSAKDLVQCPNPFIVGILTPPDDALHSTSSPNRPARPLIAGGDLPGDVSALVLGGTPHFAPRFVEGPDARCPEPLRAPAAWARLAADFDQALAGPGGTRPLGRARASAKLYAHGLMPAEAAAVAAARRVAADFVRGLCGDAITAGGWRRYTTSAAAQCSSGCDAGSDLAGLGSEHREVAFVPAAFLAPRVARLALQSELVHSQMFHSLLAHCQGAKAV